MERKLSRIFIFFFSLLSFQSFSAIVCEVDVKRVLIYKDGHVNVLHSGRNDFMFICNLQEARQDVSVSTCAMWTSMLQNIQYENRKAIFYYQGSGSCSDLPTYGNAPVPFYIGTV